MSTRLKLVAVVLVAVIPALAVTLYTRVSPDEKQEVLATLTARHAAAGQGRLVEGARQLAGGLGLLSAFASAPPALCNAAAVELTEHYEDVYTSFARAGRDGDLDCQAQPTPQTVNVTDRLYFERALETKGFSVGEYQVGRVTGLRSIAFGQPVIRRGEVESVLILAMSQEAVSRNLNAVERKDEDTTLYVLDGAGKVLAATHDEDALVGKAPDAEIVGIALERHEGTAKAEGPDGRTRTFGFEVVEGLPEDQNLYVLAGIAPTARRGLLAPGVVALAGLLALAAAWVVGGRRDA